MSAIPDPVDRRGFLGLAVGRPIAVLVAFVTLMVLGGIAYWKIPMQLLPSEFAAPSVFIWIPNPGGSARENEEEIARPLEEQLRTLSGIKELETESYEDWVECQIEFDGFVDMDLAKAEVRDRIERARPLFPRTAENPGMWTESAASLPITFFGILMQGDEEDRERLMEKVVVPRLEAVQGVGKVTVWGTLEDSVRILLDEDKVAAAQLDIGGLIRRLSADNFAEPLGELDDGGHEIILRSDMRFKSVEEIAEYPLANGLKVKDVASVERVQSVENSLSRIDGGYAYFGMATKDSQSNVVETSRAFEAELEALERDPALGGQMSYISFFLQGKMIEDALGQMRGTALSGGALALIVLFVFLRRVRLTLCVALSIPVSAVLAVAFEYFRGETFNVLTMTGITLAIGMLVDNAIVVVENIVRLHQLGLHPHEAAVRGTREIALAVTLATLTSVVVFMPLIFMTENPMVRVMFGGLGIPLTIALLASLLVAVVFFPVICARMLGARPAVLQRGAAATGALWRLPARAVAYLVAGLRMIGYAIVQTVFRVERVVLAILAPLRWVLAAGAVGLAVLVALGSRAPFASARALEPFGAGLRQEQRIFSIALGVVAALVVALALLGLPRWRRRPDHAPARPASFLPAGDSLVDMVIEVNRRLVKWAIEHRFAAAGLAAMSFAATAIPFTLVDKTPFGQSSSDDSVGFEVSFNADFTLAEAAEEVAVYEDFLEGKRAEYGFDHWSDRFDETEASINLYFERARPETEIDRLEETLKRDLPRVSGHTLRFYEESDAVRTSNSIVTFTLTGPDSDELETLGAEAVLLLAQVPGLSEISSPLDDAPEEIRVAVDRDKADKRGVDSERVEGAVSYSLRGFPLPRYQEHGRDVPFLIEFDESQTAGLPTLTDLSVFGAGGPVALSSIAEFSYAKASRSIRRKNGQTSFSIRAKVGDPLQVVSISQAGYRALQELDLPRGYAVSTEDLASQRQEEEFSELLNALLLSIVLVFLLMGILFESILLPFSVLFTIPFAIAGSFWTLFLSDTAFDSMGYIGMIILAGVVVNNGIVLIDCVHALRREGMPRAEAVVTGCGRRVRPILMTALTTVVGLLPMIAAEPPSNGFDYRALAAIVAGGLTASTFFTLWVVPLAYTVLDDFAHLVPAKVRWWLALPSRWVGRGAVRTAPLA